MVLPNPQGRPAIQINGSKMPRLGWNDRTVIYVSGVSILLFLVLTVLPIHQPIQKLSTEAKELKRWEEGVLEIHHLRVGPSESSFIIFPDGTTMMVDAGDINLAVKLPELWKRGHEGLQIRPPFPSANKSTSEWAVDYIHHFWPRPNEPMSHRKLDNFLLTHFHTDHMGDNPHPSMPWNDPIKQQYRLTGISEVANLLPIRKIVDRGYPHYNYPPFLRNWTKMDSYRTFLEEQKSKGFSVEKFVVGSNTQFRLERDSSFAKEFQVLNIKGDLEVYFESNGTIATIPGEIFSNAAKTKWDENEMSSVIRIDYGAFRYYEGGDVEAHTNAFGSIDTVTPTAVAAGKVDVATANHHGRGTNQAFCTEIDPAVVIMQGLFSDQPLVETMEFLTQPRPAPIGNEEGAGPNEKRLLLVTDIFPERLRAIGPEYANALDAINGHVVIRVSKPGPDQTYTVYMLNSKREIKAQFGPFVPRRLT